MAGVRQQMQLTAAGRRAQGFHLRGRDGDVFSTSDAKDWDSNGRFPGSEPSVKGLNDMILAITAEPDGMMSWLRDRYQNS